MFKKIQAKLKDKKGFTLIELLIVIAVLGIIAAIAIPRFTGVLDGVKDKADMRAAELFAKEIEAEFMVENWTIPEAGLTVGPVVDKPRNGFDGNIPADSKGDPMVAQITKSTAGVYTLTIKDAAKAVDYLFLNVDDTSGNPTAGKVLTPPIQ